MEGTSRIATEKGVLEYCATSPYPNDTYDQRLMIAGVYRPPESPRQDYAAALKEMISPNRKENVSTISAGAQNVNTWGKEYENWLRGEEIWELADPNTPTHEPGTTGDAMLFLAREYIPEGILPGKAETEKEVQMMEYYPVRTTEKKVLRDHMAQSLTLRTVRPGIRSGCKRYNVRGMNRPGWDKQQAQLVATPEFRDTQTLLAEDLDGREGVHPATLYHKINKVLRKAFAKRYAKPKRLQYRNGAKTFLRNNKQHARIKEYADVLEEQKSKECGEI